MRDAMRGVASNGTAAGVFTLPGYDVGAKTGTAEIGGAGTGIPPSNNGWMIAWAGPQGQTPTAVVAVVIPNEAGFGNATTGAVVAGPVANQLLQATLAVQARNGH
jgi:cell division protein FtsI/penicillin-binding protein 2